MDLVERITDRGREKSWIFRRQIQTNADRDAPQLERNFESIQWQIGKSPSHAQPSVSFMGQVSQ
jgi:hypothetical protein